MTKNNDRSEGAEVQSGKKEVEGKNVEDARTKTYMKELDVNVCK